MKLKIEKFKEFGDVTGSLIPFYLDKHLKNFKIKRFFFLYGNDKHPRADHAHKKCNQIIIPIKGSTKVEIITRKRITKIFGKLWVGI